MRPWKRVVIEIIRRPFRAIILAMTIFTLSILSMMGNFLKDAVNTGYKQYVNLEGYSIGVDKGSEGDISSQIIEEILRLDYVVGYNNNGNYQFDYKPVNFKNIPYKSDSYASVKTSANITLCGNLNTHLYSSFRNGNMILKDGVFPSSQQKGVIIDSMLADKNDLVIGNKIELYNDFNDSIMTLGVVGIYETLEPPEIEAYSEQAIYYTISPSSYIFCDYDSFFEFNDLDNSLMSLIFYVDEYEHIEPVYNKIKEILPEDEYIVANLLKSRTSDYGEVINKLADTSKLLLQFTYITSLIILFLMTLLWMRDHYYETGIYIALGTSKIQIVMYFLAEILLITLPTLCISLFTGYQIVYRYGKNILDIALDFTSSQFTDGIGAKVFDAEISLQSILVTGGIHLLILIIATLLSSVSIANYKTRKLFDSD